MLKRLNCSTAISNESPNMLRTILLCMIPFGLVACDTVARGAANSTGYVVKQGVRGTYAVGKAATRTVYRGGRYVVVGPNDEDIAVEE